MSEVWSLVTCAKNQKCKSCGQKGHFFQNCPRNPKFLQRIIGSKKFLEAGTLLLLKVQDLVGIPERLKEKHFWIGSPLNDLKAKHVSQNRNQICSKTRKKICKNTVFEVEKFDDSTKLSKYIVLAGLNNWLGKAIVVSNTRLNTYQCKKETDNWRPGRYSGPYYAIFAGEAYNYHLIPDFIEFKKIEEY